MASVVKLFEFIASLRFKSSRIWIQMRRIYSCRIWPWCAPDCDILYEYGDVATFQQGCFFLLSISLSSMLLS